jgi:molybdenum cofactor cytidylyltransferase
MGTPKLLLPWNGTSVLGHLVLLWKQLQASPVIVVRAAGDGDIERELNRLQIPDAHRVCNPHPDLGMFSSVKRGAGFAWSPAITHVALVLGDQPHLPEAALRGFLRFAAAHPQQISQPFRGEHGRHPVILTRQFLRETLVTDAPTLKEFLGARQKDIARFETDDASFDLDMDYPEDYRAALRLSEAYSDSEPPPSQPS